jgi:hypothetical protein
MMFLIRAVMTLFDERGYKMKYDPLTRFLHLMMAVGVSLQMLTSLVMVTPKPGRRPNDWWEIHETTGMVVLGVVAVYWGWILVRAFTRQQPLMLFPWFSRQQRAELWLDIVESWQDIRVLRMPVGDTARPLPCAVQGLGLLAALFMALTGTIVELGMGLDGAVSPTIHTVKEMHETMAPLMWAYLLVHPLLGALHQFSGHRSFNRMFRIG